MTFLRLHNRPLPQKEVIRFGSYVFGFLISPTAKGSPTMGGKNHQPCRNYLPNSTELSRATSLALAKLELANVALEDIILGELGGVAGTVAPVVEHLSASRAALTTARAVAGRLRGQMEDENFRDLPSLRQTNLDDLGCRLARGNIVDPDAWSRISGLMANGGFFSILTHFESSIDELAEKTDRLVDHFSSITDVVARGELTSLVEDNESRNFKVPFADLYNTWSNFQREFVASSMLSTELWYIHSGCGSLIEVQQLTEVTV